jgi:hypothetical protein
MPDQFDEPVCDGETENEHQSLVDEHPVRPIETPQFVVVLQNVQPKVVDRVIVQIFSEHFSAA